MNLVKKFNFVVCLAGVFFLSACGDNSSSYKSTEEKEAITTVETFDDLVHCTKSHYGEIAYVEEEKTYFECTSEDWVEVDPRELDSLLLDKSSSSTIDGLKSSSSFVVDSSEIAKVEIKKVDSVTVIGFAQKGPYASGSVVTVYGLDSLLKVTKTKFTGKVQGDSGAFKVEKIALPSQYALVEVSGFYTSEVSGKKTSGTKTTLSALADLSNGKTISVNVNLFTELEYARARDLVLKQKFNVPAAKKRATTELLSLFGGSETNDLMATSISLFDTTQAGKGLLFASVLMQSDLSASKFGRRLSDAAERFATSGALDDAEMLVAMADWASKVDSTDNFASIRENVKAMNLAATVPDFESSLYGFWTGVYGLGECSESLESTIKKNENKLSDNYGAGYACTALRWHKATVLDTELGLCTGQMEGEFKEYNVKKGSEYYVCRSGTWQEISETQFNLKECSEKRNNEYVESKSGEFFVCIDKQWLELDSVTYELKLCTENRNFEVAKTNKWGSYVCQWDGKSGTWRRASEMESEYGVCGTKAYPDSTIERLSTSYYACLGGTWTEIDALTGELNFCTESLAESIKKTSNGSYYVCDSGTWREASDVETILGICKPSLDGDVRWTGKNVDLSETGYQTENYIPDQNDSTGFFYECDGKKWQPSNSIRYYYGSSCVDGVMHSVVDSTYFIKFFNKLPENTLEAIFLGLALVSIPGQDYTYVMCENNDWKAISAGEYTNPDTPCDEKIDSTFVNGYACVHDKVNFEGHLIDNYYWRSENSGEKANEHTFCTSKKVSYEVQNGYVCEESWTGGEYICAWRLASYVEKKLGKVCNYNIKNLYNDGYVCDMSSGDYAWREATAGEKANESLCLYETNHTKVLNGYICDEDNLEWRVATEGELINGYVCNKYSLTGTVKNGYLCEKNSSGKYSWRLASEGEIAFGGACDTSEAQVIRGGYACVCKNTSNSSCYLREASSSEKSVNAVCENNDGKFIIVDSTSYRCTDSDKHLWTLWIYDTITDNREKKNPQTYRVLTIDNYTVMVDNLNFQGSGTGDLNWGWIPLRGGTLYRWTSAAGVGVKNLYNQYSFTGQLRGICPDGWHLPSGSSSGSEIGWLSRKMTKEDGLLLDVNEKHSECTQTTNCYNNTDNARELVKGAGWWGSSNVGKKAYAIYYSSKGDVSSFEQRPKIDMYYIRCIKDY